MSSLSLDQARAIADAALVKGREMDLKPLTVAVLDSGGHLVAFLKEGGGPLRFNIATGKAWGAIGMGMSSRALANEGEERPLFMQSLMDASGGRVVPVPGGVLIREAEGEILGAVGISGDLSDNDAAAAVAGIEAAGLVADDS